MNEIDIVSHFKRFNCHGNGLIVKGRPRSGKTYLLGILARLLIDNGFAVVSNVRFSDHVLDQYAGKLYYIINDLDYFKAYLDIDPGVPIVLMFDDSQAQQGMTSTGVMSKEGKKLASFLVFIGKLETNYVYVAHRDYIPHSITEGFDPVVIYKYDQPSFWIGDRLYENRTLVQANCHRVMIPSPDQYQGLEILSKGTAWFNFDLDLEGLFKHLSNRIYGENLRQGVYDFLTGNDQADPDEALKSMTQKDLIKALAYKYPDLKGSDKLYKLFNREILYDTLSDMKQKTQKSQK